MRESIIWLPWKWAQRRKQDRTSYRFKQFEWVIWKGKRRKKPVSNNKQEKKQGKPQQ